MEFSNYKAHELKDIIAKKEASIEEITKSHLCKIENTDSKVDAFLYVANEEALIQAKQLDEKLSKGGDLGVLGIEEVVERGSG